MHNWCARDLWSVDYTTFLKRVSRSIINYYSEHDTFPDEVPSVYTISSTRNVTYGDGGGNALKYPLYICDRLNVEDRHYKTLKTELRNMGVAKNDYREGEPIQNVIDPDIYSLRLDRNKFVDKFNELFPKCSGVWRWQSELAEFKENTKKKWVCQNVFNFVLKTFEVTLTYLLILTLTTVICVSLYVVTTNGFRAYFPNLIATERLQSSLRFIMSEKIGNTKYCTNRLVISLNECFLSLINLSGFGTGNEMTFKSLLNRKNMQSNHVVDILECGTLRD